MKSTDHAVTSKLVEARESPIHGTGCFARQAIAKDTFIGEYVGPAADTDGMHVLWLEEDGNWQGRNGTGLLRYLNHSNAPNTAFWDHDLYALRDIQAREELTIDYGEDWANTP